MQLIPSLVLYLFFLGGGEGVWLAKFNRTFSDIKLASIDWGACRLYRFSSRSLWRNGD